MEEETYEDMFKYSISPEKKVYYWVAIKLLTFKKRNDATVDIAFRWFCTYSVFLFRLYKCLLLLVALSTSFPVMILVICSSNLSFIIYIYIYIYILTILCGFIKNHTNFSNVSGLINLWNYDISDII